MRFKINVMARIARIALKYSASTERTIKEHPKSDPEFRERARNAVDSKQKHDLFTCPECGSHYWGTSGADDMTTATGHCHGMVEDSGWGYCGFTWARAEDEKFFGPRNTAEQGQAEDE